jgi:hypothetical protein
MNHIQAPCRKADSKTVETALADLYGRESDRRPGAVLLKSEIAT